MSAIGTKRTSACALHMSAFGGKADIALTCTANVPLMTQSGHARLLRNPLSGEELIERALASAGVCRMTQEAFYGLELS